MEPECSPTCPLQLTTGFWPKPQGFGQNPHTLMKIHFNNTSSKLRYSKRTISSGFLIKILYTFLVFIMLALRPIYLTLLDLTAQEILGEV